MGDVAREVYKDIGTAIVELSKAWAVLKKVSTIH